MRKSQERRGGVGEEKRGEEVCAGSQGCLVGREGGRDGHNPLAVAGKDSECPIHVSWCHGSCDLNGGCKGSRVQVGRHNPAPGSFSLADSELMLL